MIIETLVAARDKLGRILAGRADPSGPEPLLERVAQERYRPEAMASRAWQPPRRTLLVAEQLPDDATRHDADDRTPRS